VLFGRDVTIEVVEKDWTKLTEDERVKMVRFIDQISIKLQMFVKVLQDAPELETFLGELESKITEIRSAPLLVNLF